MSNVFEEYRMDSKQLTTAIKREGTSYHRRAVAIQGLIMAVACEIEEGETANMTALVHALSKTDGEFKLTSESRQIGQYMKAFLPLKWNVKKAEFEIDTKKEVDFANALKNMENIPWNTYKVERPAQAFDPAKKLGAAIGILKAIKKHAEEIHDVKLDDPAYKKATTLLKAAGE